MGKSVSIRTATGGFILTNSEYDKMEVVCKDFDEVVTEMVRWLGPHSKVPRMKPEERIIIKIIPFSPPSGFRMERFGRLEDQMREQIEKTELAEKQSEKPLSVEEMASALKTQTEWKPALNKSSGDRILYQSPEGWMLSATFRDGRFDHVSSMTSPEGKTGYCTAWPDKHCTLTPVEWNDFKLALSEPEGSFKTEIPTNPYFEKALRTQIKWTTAADVTKLSEGEHEVLYTSSENWKLLMAYRDGKFSHVVKMISPWGLESQDLPNVETWPLLLPPPKEGVLIFSGEKIAWCTCWLGNGGA
jgi:hypothetical protein